MIETLIISLFFQLCCQLGHTPVIKSLLQRDGNRLSLNILRHVAILFPYFKRRVRMRSDRTVIHRFISFFYINSRNPFQDGIYNHRNRMVTNHAIIVLSPQLPDRQITVIFILTNHTLHKISHPFRLQQSVKRMRSTKSIPKRECSIMRLVTAYFTGCIVRSHVFTIHVRHGIRLNHCMVKGGIEYLLLQIGSFHVNLSQFLLPVGICCCHIPVEIPMGRFLFHVLTGVFHRDRRKGYFAIKRFTIQFAKAETAVEIGSINHRCVIVCTPAVP